MWHRAMRWWRAGRARKPPTERWPSRGTYIVVAVALAAGGLLWWRFPSLALQHGGGTFLIAYAVSLAAVAVPLLIVESALGQRGQRAAPRAYRSLRRAGEWIGWGGVGISYFLVVGQTLIVTWALVYAAGSIDSIGHTNAPPLWAAGDTGASDPALFFEEEVFGTDTLGTGETGRPSWSLPLPGIVALLFGLWAILLLTATLGPRVLAEVTRYAMVGAILFGLIVAVRFLLLLTEPSPAPGDLADGGGSVMLGAVYGLDWALSVDASKWGSLALWADAITHALLSLAVGTGAQVTMAGYLPREADVTNNARFVGLLSATLTIGVFLAIAALLGTYALAEELPVEAITANFRGEPTEGVGTVLLVIPQALASPEFAVDSAPLRAVWAAGLFLSLAGLSFASGAVLLHHVVASVRQRWPIPRWRLAGMLVLPAFVLSLILVGFTRWDWMTGFDQWLIRPAILIVALASAVLVGWFAPFQSLRRAINRVSEQPAGLLWSLLIRLVVPIVLTLVILAILLP